MSRDALISITIAAGALLTGLLFGVDAASPLRAIIAVAFLLFAPGLTFVRLFGLRDPLTVATLAVAASLGMETVIATALLVSGLWSPGAALAIIVLLTLAGVGLHAATSVGASSA